MLTDLKFESRAKISRVFLRAYFHLIVTQSVTAKISRIWLSIPERGLWVACHNDMCVIYCIINSYIIILLYSFIFYYLYIIYYS